MPSASSAGGVLRAIGRTALGLALGAGLCAPLLGAEVTGFVKREIWYHPGTGEPNANPATFANTNYPNNPDAITFLTSFAAPQTANPNVEDYLSKLSGFIHPAADGDYVFYFSSDDHGALYLSTDDSPANLKLIAQEGNWSNPLQWTTSGGGSSVADKRSDQFAGTTWPSGAKVHLLKSKKYYAVAFDKEGGGGDNTGVTMLPVGTEPTDADPSTLTGALISTEGPTALTVLQQPVGQTAFVGRPVVFSVSVEPVPGNPVQDETQVVPAFTYQWSKDGVALPFVDANSDGIADDGSNTATLTIDPVVKANAGKYTCKISTADGTSITSAAATLVVNDDTVPPTMTAAAGDGNAANALTKVVVTFNEKMDLSSIGTAGNYKISGGVTVSAVATTSTSAVLTTSKQAEGATLTLTVTGAKDVAGNALTPNTTTFHALSFSPGHVNVQRYDADDDEPDAFIISDRYLTGVPSYSAVLSQFYYPQTSPNLDHFVSHLSGYFVPPATGDYVFFLSADDHASLYLSTDDSPANVKVIAKETTWSNAGNWATSDNAAADLPSKRSDQFADTTWPTGATITLTKGKRYYMESFAHEGGGGDDNTVTYKLASDADPANGSTALKGDAVGTYVDLSTLPPDAPVITTRPTGVHFNKGDKLTFSVVATAKDPITYQWYRSKKAIAGATNATLTLLNAGPEAVGDYLVAVTAKNPNGTVTTESYPDDNVRAIMNGAFVIESEDFNFGGGKTVAAASTMPLATNLYAGLDGLPGIDFHLVNQSTGDGTANGNAYRNGTTDAPTFPTAPEALGNIDITGDVGNSDRGSYTFTANYKIGWGDPGEWYQYTRDFPPGVYNAVLSAGLDGRGTDNLGSILQIVTGDPTKVGAATTNMGTLLSNGTGAWSSDDLIGYKNTDGTMAEMTLGAKTTVRTVMSVGGYDFDFILFYKVRDVGGAGPTISIGADGKITYTGTLSGASDPAGPYTPVAGATSPFTPNTAAAAAKFYRSGN